MKKIKNNVQLIQEYFDELFPNVGCFLHYSKDYELVIAVMLSAQTTDLSVNKITPILFQKYNSLEKLANAELKDIQQIIHPLGLFKTKSKRIIEIASILHNIYNDCVPQDKKLLINIPGIGNKTACVIRAELFHIPEFPVDTHIKRISNRLNIVNNVSDVNKIESKLKETFPSKNWIKLHHQFIQFGREICCAKNPNCKICKLRNICKNSAKTD